MNDNYKGEKLLGNVASTECARGRQSRKGLKGNSVRPRCLAEETGWPPERETEQKDGPEDAARQQETTVVKCVRMPDGQVSSTNLDQVSDCHSKEQGREENQQHGQNAPPQRKNRFC
jgi:hypothetical protein